MAGRYDPFRDMHRFIEQTRRAMWGDDVGEFPGIPYSLLEAGHAPDRDTNLDVEETDEGYVVVADLPGFETDDLSIRFEDGVLTIHGESETAEESAHGARSQRRFVHERVPFPSTVRRDEITASYHNGVLEVTLPTEGEPEDDEFEIEIE